VTDAARPADIAEAAARRSKLLGIKLQALVSEHAGTDVRGEPGTFPHGSALLVDDAAWVLIDGAADRSLGGALAWARRHGAASLQLVAAADTGLLARRAERLRFPVSVWFAQDRTLFPAVAEPLASPPEPPGEHLAFLAVIADAGATPNVEHGVVFGEVRGLEVCRVVDEPTIGHIVELGDVGLAEAPTVPAATGVLLEVGVGANDREAFRMLHGDIPTVEALATVVDSVAAVRSTDAPQHPLNRLGQERFLRWRLEQDPSLVDVAQVQPAQPPIPRPNLKDPVPCVATARTHDDRTVTVVCSVGVDLDLVGFVADVQTAGGGPVVVALRRRDVVPITEELLGLLDTPVEIRPV
jgi:hypothetical protein